MGNEARQFEKFSAGGFLYNPEKREVLLHLRDKNIPVNPSKWGFFSGTSEGDESPRECCVREWKEELGIVVEANDLILLCDYPHPLYRRPRYTFYWETDLPKDAMTLGEGVDFDWIPLEKVFQYDLCENTRRDLKIFLETLA